MEKLLIKHEGIFINLTMDKLLFVSTFETIKKI